MKLKTKENKMYNMRTKTLKINDVDTESILVCGGPNYKVYIACGFEGYVIQTGTRLNMIREFSESFDVVARFVTLKYQPLPSQPLIGKLFLDIVKNLAQRKDV